MKCLTISVVLVIIAAAGFLVSGETAPAYKGEYTLQCMNVTTGESYTEEVKIYGPMDGTFIIECTYGDDLASGDGIEFNGLLFAYRTAIGYPVSVYKKEGSELYGLVVTEDGEIIKKSAKGECPLVLHPIDSTLAGKYYIEGEADDGTIPYADTIILEPEGQMWSVSRVDHVPGFEDQPGTLETAGSGFSVGDVVALHYYDSNNGMDFLKVYDFGREELKGRWIVYYWDVEQNCAVVITGQEHAERIEQE